MKFIFLLLILSLLLFDAAAQDNKKIEFQIGAGTNLSIPYKKQIVISIPFGNLPAKEYNSRFGYFAECLVTYNFNDRIGVNSGLNYSLNNINEFVDFDDISTDYNLRFSYFQIPVLLKYQLHNNLPLSVYVGPYFGFLVSAREKGKISGLFTWTLGDPVFEEIEVDNDIKEYYSNFDMGLSFRIDYSITLNEKLNGMVFTGFNMGLTNTIENKSYEWRNYGLILGLGIKF